MNDIFNQLGNILKPQKMDNYNIDKDINLYSLAELQTMQRVWENKNANHSAIPFTLQEIKTEITKRSKPKKGDKVKVDIWNYKTKEIDQIKGKVIGIVTALDREYRVNLILEDGREIQEAAPECVHILNH